MLYSPADAANETRGCLDRRGRLAWRVAPVSNHAEGATGPKLLGTGEVSYWSYDQFGNRKQEAFSTATTTPCASGSSGNVGNPVIERRVRIALNPHFYFIEDRKTGRKGDIFRVSESGAGAYT